MTFNNIDILFISIAFPPKKDPECLQTAKYFKYLVKDKHLNIDVVTSHDKALFMSYDSSLNSYAKGYRQIIKIPFFENKYINFLLRKLNRSILNYPDSKFRFAKKYKYVLKKLQNRPNLIYSRSFPLSSTIMAYKLHKSLKVPWILHLSDPWTFGSLQDLGEARKWNLDMEYKCFNSASAITFTSYKTLEKYKEIYPEFSKKMYFFPNVYEDSDINNKYYNFNNKIRVVCTGSLIKANKRDPKYFFEALEKFKNTNPTKIDKFEFIFVGQLDRLSKKEFKYYLKKIPQIKYLGELSYQDAIKLQFEADVLLTIDVLYDSFFFPSKLLDYMVAKRYILAITKKDSCTDRFVKHNLLGDSIEHQNINLIVETLNKIYNNWERKNKDFFVRDNVLKEFSAQFNAKRLIELFKEQVFKNGYKE